jgi:hypothetical protein
MRIVVALVAAVVFVALLSLDTDALLRLIFSWAVQAPTYRWILIGGACAAVAFYISRRRRNLVDSRFRADPARVSHQPKAKRLPKSRPKVRRRPSTRTQVGR